MQQVVGTHVRRVIRRTASTSATILARSPCSNSRTARFPCCAILEGLSGDATCAALGLERAAMKTRLHRAREKLRTLLVQPTTGRPRPTD